MAWGPEMRAGFTLAALLLDDRDLAQVERALPSGSVAGFEAELALAHARDQGVGALLRVLRPELTLAGARRLPPRARGLIARLFPAPAKKTLMSEAPRARAEYALDEELLRVLARMARSPSDLEGP